MDPLQQQQISASTVAVYLAIEEQLLLNAAKQLKKNKRLLTEENIIAWQTEQLSMLGNLTQRNVISIAKYSSMAVNEVTTALEEAGYGTVKQYEGILIEAVQMGLLVQPPDVGQSSALEGILSAYQSQALNTLNMVNTTMLNQAQQGYIDVINQTVGKVLAGAVTPQQALKGTVKRWASDGIPALIDKGGKKWSTEAYVNMIMRSASNNVANEMQLSRAQEYGVDLIEVSSHVDARPGCAPYQGRIYSLSGNHDKYPPLNSTSYGEAAGLKGVNCRHIFYPFVEGVSIKRYEPYDQKENEKAYRESQQQRQLERNIRKAKRELAMMEAMGNETGIQEAKKKVKEKQFAMREFIERSGRTRRRNREQIV